MPCQLLDALSIVLLYELLALILVVSQHDTLQECIWELQFTYLLLAVLANVENELIIRIVNELCLQALCNLSTESCLVLHVSILTENLLKELFVDFMLLETLDFCNLEAELWLQVLNSFTLNLQEWRNLSIVLWISLLRVECDYITELSIVEEILLLVNLDVARHQDRTLYSDTTFLGIAIFIKLTQVTLQKVILLVLLSLLIATCTLSVHINLLIENLIINCDVIIINLVATIESYLELWSNSDIKHKCERSTILQVSWLLLLWWERLTEHLDIVVLYILVNLLTNELVDSFHFYRWTELTLNHTHRSLTRTETWNISLLTIIFQCLLDIILVIFLFDNEGQKTINLVRIFKWNFHLDICYFIIVNIFFNSTVFVYNRNWLAKLHIFNGYS